MNRTLLVCIAWFIANAAGFGQEPKATIIRDGKATMPLVVGSDREAGETLRSLGGGQKGTGFSIRRAAISTQTFRICEAWGPCHASSDPWPGS
ncbi:MAG: hypothetical protein K2X38_18035 [Gemmataceae bacterium]|nr:hypothetical protein [Gemmataceae bacterium]